MAVCYTNNMDDLVLLYERVDSGSVYVHLHQKVQPALSNLTVSYMKIPHKLCLVLACLLLALLLLLLFLACNSRLRSARHTSTSSPTEGGSEPNLLLQAA